MESYNLSAFSNTIQSPTLSLKDSYLSQEVPHSLHNVSRLRQPWRHSVSRYGPLPTSRTVREYKPERQRRRLFAQGFMQWLITFAVCGLLAACLGIFGEFSWMTVQQVKTFNALIVLLSLFLGAALVGSFKEMALMLRWRILAARYRSLNDFELIMHCDSLRQVMKLTWIARTPGQPWFLLNKTQWLCLAWLGVNILLQVLVALLGLTYNLGTSTVPARKFGLVSIANLTTIDDPWNEAHLDFSSQLGESNIYGSQAQYYQYKAIIPTTPKKGVTYGKPSIPTVYYNEDYSTFSYIFQDSNPFNNDLTLVSHRNISSTTTCEQMKITEGGNGSSSIITYLDENGLRRTLDVISVGPGAMTYIGVLNSTCGPRCSKIMALQSANGGTIPSASFFKCQNAMTAILGIEEYLQGNLTESIFQISESKTRIFAGAIGWTGFNYTQGDAYQYVRYPTQSWWSPNYPVNASRISKNIMEYSIGAVASFDYNGPRSNVTGYYPVLAQEVTIQWQWSVTILVMIPSIHLIALICVITWGNSVIIRDGSCLSEARLLRPVVERLGEKGCLLTGREIVQELAEIRVKYGWREPESDMGFRDEIDTQIFRHVDILEENEGLGLQGTMPPGRYDGLVNSNVREKHRVRRSMSI